MADDTMTFEATPTMDIETQDKVESAERAAENNNVGAAISRVDGPLKVTGQARYAADFAVPNPLYAHLVISTIGKGRITGIDDQAARQVKGVREIYSHANKLDEGSAKFFAAGGQAQQSWEPFAEPDVRFYGETIGLVVAETILGAREAAAELVFQYESEDPAAVIDASGVERQEMPDKAVTKGDFDSAFEAAPVKIDSDYETAPNVHNAMELFATTAHWVGDKLTVYVPSQWVKGFQIGLAEELGIDEANIEVVCPFVGGGFGGKGSLFTWVSLIAAASRDLGRPVKLYVTREQGFTTASFRAETRQSVRLAAAEDGTFQALEHTGDELTSRADNYFVNGQDATVRMYQADAIRTGLTTVHADRQTPGFMRAPAETPYFFGLESAVDEIARELSMDPVELRIKNDTMIDPVDGVPYTSRSLKECFRQGGESFGWSNYTPEIGSMNEGEWMIGWGVATATYPTQMSPCTVRIHLDVSGEARLQVASHDVGTGAYTVLTQAVADELGIPVEKVRVELGDSRLPPGTIAGGSISTASNVSAIMIACERIRQRLGLERGADNDLAAAFENFGQAGIEEYAEWNPSAAKKNATKTLYNGQVMIVGGPEEDYTAFAFGAIFSEVRINRFTHEIRVPRMTGAFAAGRIMNAKTAKSQYLGGMVWGIGHALHETAEVDPRTGAYMNDNISEYLVPVNADVPNMDAIIVPEVDDKVNPAGVKGIGEIGIVGVAASIANAVHHATGTRLRRIPIRLEDLVQA
ncbi:xanthine dehydrogenase family protein molybdopterin-binding subunit [Jiella marina]|uniref:xanthine dehydrogenase family protein molybdopterin-binding subunit n=1 Tax=Jiella sp. LLJ827 TaxID=2917712 RepID=UPI002101361F|nr:xanthine dehydrogenase family protein molybdopterin-binding subunit [Jiella sp. LLJ827]MCQ0986963.1 xanthine dehydrogenase family protein molybdopterin-binding subunit [Jiella sp. LLJ827]